jgi:probable HAF family extracellular repeat protein
MNWFRRALCGLLLIVPPVLEAQLTYTVHDLGTLGGTGSLGNALNNSGRVAGASYLLDNQAQNAFVTGANGALPLRNLGTLGGTESFGQAISDSGLVAGIASTGSDSFHAFLTDGNGGALGDLGTLGGSNSYAYGLNGAGQVAGYFTRNNGVNHAFLTDSRSMAPVDLLTLPGGSQSFAFAVNASGQVTGYSGTASGFNHAFISDPDGGALRDLGTLGGRFSFGAAINNAGSVAGRSETSTVGQHAFLSGPNGGPLLDLGTLGGFSSYAEGVNSAGVAVGYSFLSDNGTQHAFIYTAAERMRDLNGLLVAGTGWVLTDAKAINDRGQITGTGKFGTEMHAFLLTPVPAELRIVSISHLENGNIRVRGLGTPFQSYTVEVTTDLAGEFAPVMTVAAGSDGTLQFEDAATGFVRLFYRFVAAN